MLYLIPVLAIASGAFLLWPRRVNDVKKVKRRIVMNVGVFFVAAILLVTCAMTVSASSEPAPQDTAAQTEQQAAPSESNGLGYLAAALATGLSCLGAGIAIASTAPAAIGAFSEDPKAFGKAMIFVVLGEGVALYGLLVSILLINKL